MSSVGAIGVPAARVGDDIAHTMARFGLIAGLALGALLAAATIATGGAALVVVAAVAAGAASGGLVGMAVGGMYMGPPTGKLTIGSPDVRINNRPATMTYASFAACGHHSGAPVPVATGSATVRINDGFAAREGETMGCSAIIVAPCSPDVIIGGESIQDPRVEIKPEIPEWVVTALTVVAVAGGIVALAGAGIAVVAAGGTMRAAGFAIARSAAKDYAVSKAGEAAGGQIGYALDGERGRSAGQLIGGEATLPGRGGRPKTPGARGRPSPNVAGPSAGRAGSTPGPGRSSTPGGGNASRPGAASGRSTPARPTSPSSPRSREPITDPARLLAPPRADGPPSTRAPITDPGRLLAPPRADAPATPRQPITDPGRLLPPPRAPMGHKPLSPAERSALRDKVNNRTATKAEYRQLESDRRFNAPHADQHAAMKDSVAEELRSLRDGGIVRDDLGPAISVARDRTTGVTSGVYTNTKGELPKNLDNTLGDRIPGAKQLDYVKTHGAGSHSEVAAVNDLLRANPGTRLEDIDVYTASTKGALAPKAGDLAPQTMPPCPHCAYILDGVNYVD